MGSPLSRTKKIVFFALSFVMVLFMSVATILHFVEGLVLLGCLAVLLTLLIGLQLFFASKLNRELTCVFGLIACGVACIYGILSELPSGKSDSSSQWFMLFLALLSFFSAGYYFKRFYQRTTNRH